MQEEYIRSWLQVIPKDIVHGCLNAYYEGTQWNIPPVCSVCSRRQYAVEMHDIVLNSNEEIPEYLSILRNEEESLFSNDEFQFVDSRLDSLMLDPDRLQVNKGCTTLRVCRPRYGYLSRLLMP